MLGLWEKYCPPFQKRHTLRVGRVRGDNEKKVDRVRLLFLLYIVPKLTEAERRCWQPHSRCINCLSRGLLPMLRNFLCIGRNITIQFLIETYSSHKSGTFPISHKLLNSFPNMPTYHLSSIWMLFFVICVANKWFFIYIYRNIFWKCLMSLNIIYFSKYSWSAYFFPSIVPGVEKQKYSDSVPTYK